MVYKVAESWLLPVSAAPSFFTTKRCVQQVQHSFPKTAVLACAYVLSGGYQVVDNTNLEVNL